MLKAKALALSFIGIIGFHCSCSRAEIVSTALAKVLYTQGHTAPSCRMVSVKENSTGIVRTFRIADVAGGHDDVSAVLLAALTTNRDVEIAYDPAQTSGCGSEPRIIYITIH
jgi:hypothetical protein